MVVDTPSVAEEDTSFVVDTSAVEDKEDIPVACTVEVDIQAWRCRHALTFSCRLQTTCH